MRTPARILMTSLLLTPAFLNAAEGTDSRACNLQGREIALRITEEVSGELTADDRTRIAAIAEEVCLGFAPNARNRSAQSGHPRDQPSRSVGAGHHGGRSPAGGRGRGTAGR